MADQQTLHSRLRVLVARTFRAEKLYGSVKNLRELKNGETSRFSSELANEIRSQEWQSSHTHLRTSLNEILAIGNNAEMLKQLSKLRNIFYSHYQNAEVLLNRSSAELEQANERQEYALAMRLAIDLVKQKARAQSCRLITEEIGAVLSSCGRSDQPNHIQQSAESLPELDIRKKKEEREALAAESTPSNVIPLRRKAAR